MQIRKERMGEWQVKEWKFKNRRVLVAQSNIQGEGFPWTKGGWRNEVRAMG